MRRNLLVFISLIILLPVTGFSQTSGVITKVKGLVFVMKAGSFRKVSVSVNQNIIQGDLVITGFDSTAVIKLDEGSSIVMKSNSRFKIDDKSTLNQKSGMIYYNIKKKKHRGIKVKTNFAVIGVKGTEFIVNASDKDKKVALKRGLIGIESLKKQFELHRKKEMSAFEKFMNKTKSAFKKYKEQNRTEFVQYVKSFDLKPDKVVSFSGNIADEKDISRDLDKEFLKFREMI